MGIDLIVIVENSRHISLEGGVQSRPYERSGPGAGRPGFRLPWQGLVTLKLYEEATPELIKRGEKAKKEKGGA